MKDINMESEVSERFKSIESRINRQDMRIDSIVKKQDKDHDELISIKKDTTYIKELLSEVKDKWDNWDKDNLNQRDKTKWAIIGIATTVISSVMVAVLLHFMSLK